MVTNRTFVEIENGLVRQLDVSISKEVSLEDFVKNLERKVPVTLPSMPRSQVFAHWDETNPRNKTLYILSELSPGVRTIRKRNRGSVTKKYKLGIPWTYFWFVATTSSSEHDAVNNWSISNGRVFHSKTRYENVNSPMIVARLPNLYAQGEICWGSTGTSASMSLADQIDTRVSGWYGSDFNTDLDGRVLMPYGENTMRRWVEESIENPMSWMSWPEFNDTTIQYSVKKLLEEHTGVIPMPERVLASHLIETVNLPYTYGRWEEYWRTIPLEERQRGLVALQNLMTDDAGFVPDIIADVSIDDDGGIPV